LLDSRVPAAGAAWADGGDRNVPASERRAMAVVRDQIGISWVGPTVKREPSEVMGLQVEGVPLGRKLDGFRASQSLPSEACQTPVPMPLPVSSYSKVPSLK